MAEVLIVPLLACLVLTAIHVPLGLHVLARGVIFVDLALAQVAALGLSAAFLAGHPIGSGAAYWYALAFACGAAGLFALSRTRTPALPQEAVIGIVYAVSVAAAVLVVDRAPQGGEHIKQLLVGSLLTVETSDVGRLAGAYVAVGALHWLARRPFLEISLSPETARERGRRVRAWDVLFYTSFALVVTSSVRIAGVLLVFGYLVMPAAAAALLTRSIGARLAVGWAIGAAASALGLALSYAADLPTGASVVALLGAAVALVGAARAVAQLRGDAPRVARRGLTVLGAGCVVAGALLAAFPRMDHHWLDWVEAAVPAVQETFLTERERAVKRDSERAVAAAREQLAQARTIQDEARWSTAPVDPDRVERIRQYLAGRGEIAAGDRMVLATLRGKARERQRWWIGGALVAGGAALACAARRRRGSADQAVYV